VVGATDRADLPLLVNKEAPSCTKPTSLARLAKLAGLETLSTVDVGETDAITGLARLPFGDIESGLPTPTMSRAQVPKQHRQHLHLQERAWPFDPTKYTSHIPTIDGQRKQLVSIIDSHGFDWRIWAVAATGFFTDSYNLFASNIILPCLAFVYWGSEHEANIEITTNALTLAGSTIGQLMFGFLADKYGRQRLYGVELMIVIFSTIGLVSFTRKIPHLFIADCHRRKVLSAG